MFYEWSQDNGKDTFKHIQFNSQICLNKTYCTLLYIPGFSLKVLLTGFLEYSEISVAEYII